ncbi:hypothetical protein L596_020225 [Steinernema carpocapsae]|uniref:Acyl-coenzyme A oxidase n=1 Tax=Steinernema carpocapsae TaxID=34508 RepID=A0A4U5MSY9_STECR|nr:hypothetical protein L596_020225 [Steinernema carpocapsae]
MSNVKDLIRAGDNPDITAERRKATFPIGKMSAFIHGGEEKLQRRHEILEFVESVPEFQDPIPVEFMSREERCDNNARKAVAMTDRTDAIDGSDFFGEGMFYQSLIMGRDLHAMSLHYVMFVPTLQGQTDDEQLDHWLTLAIGRGILGTYAQTELGHGTNLSKLETTATYDPKTEEFVLNSPTVTAAKWWPGSLGKSSNYAVVVAQLWTKGVCHGPHPFIVQLRDEETHMPLKGIRLGDIGPKFGINGGDNGYLLFDKLRIPRRNMLMRYSKVLENGDYVAPQHSKLGYGTMVFVRSVMIRDQSMQLAAAATIAIRYSAIRRQGELKPDNGEVQILDYQTQQFRLLPQLAKALVFLFAASEVRDLYMQVTEQLSTGNTELLAELHALSSGLKSVVSWEVAQGIEQCRMSCGGHGYSHASGLPEAYGYAVGGCTYEGENIVMLLQVARFLMKVAESVKRQDSKLSDIAAYIGLKGAKNSKFTSVDKTPVDELVRDFEHIARQQVFVACNILSENQKRMAPELAWNATSVELCKASRLHVKANLMKSYLRRVSQCQDSQIRPVLVDIGRLFALDALTHHASSLTMGGYLSDAQLLAMKQGIYTLLARLRPNAVALVDSLDFSDRELHSVLGRRDGNVYQALLEWAQQSQLNKTDVLPTFEKYLGPMMKDARSKL